MVLLAMDSKASRDLHTKNYLTALKDNSRRIEKFLMDNDRNWDRNRHCDWVTLTANPRNVMQDHGNEESFEKISMTLDMNKARELDQKSLFASSVCLFVIASANNRAEVEYQMDWLKNISLVKGKLAMVVMSNQTIDLSNMTKITFPTMVLEPNRHFPRDATQILALTLHYFTQISFIACQMTMQEHES